MTPAATTDSVTFGDVPALQDFATFGAWFTARIAHMRERNSGASLRSFAKRAKLSPSLLAMIARDERLPSDDVLSRLAELLELRSEEVQFAAALIGLRRAKTDAARQRHADRLRELRPTHSALQMTLDQIEMVSHWRHVTLLELTQLPTFREDPDALAELLGSFTTPTMIGESIALLLRLGLLKRLDDGKLQKTAMQFRSPRHLPSAAIRGFHKQMLQRAHTAIDRQPVPERFFASLTIPVPSHRVADISRRIAAFRDQLAASLGDEKDEANEVYHLNLQLIRATANSARAQGPGGE